MSKDELLEHGTSKRHNLGGIYDDFKQKTFY